MVTFGYFTFVSIKVNCEMRTKEETPVDRIIRERLVINKANLEYCAKNEIINGLLLQSIREAMESYASEQTKMLRDMIIRLNEQVEILLDPETDADSKMAISMTRELGKVLWEKFLSESK